VSVHQHRWEVTQTPPSARRSEAEPHWYSSSTAGVPGSQNCEGGRAAGTDRVLDHQPATSRPSGYARTRIIYIEAVGGTGEPDYRSWPHADQSCLRMSASANSTRFDGSGCRRTLLGSPDRYSGRGRDR
jgi:hypothetical protein